MTTDSRLDYIISRVDDVSDRLARLEQLVADQALHRTQTSGFLRWLLPVLLSIGSFAVSIGIFLTR